MNGVHCRIDTAREAGVSWTIIGAAIDITRRAAQQRFGKAGCPAAIRQGMTCACNTFAMAARPAAIPSASGGQPQVHQESRNRLMGLFRDS
jgi:hypothetical protein